MMLDDGGWYRRNDGEWMTDDHDGAADNDDGEEEGEVDGRLMMKNMNITTVNHSQTR